MSLTKTYLITKDGMISDGVNADINFATTLEGITLVSGISDDSRTIHQFDLSNIAGSTVISSTLSFFAYDSHYPPAEPPDPPPQLYGAIYKLLNDWEHDTVTWNSLTPNGGNYDTSISAVVDEKYITDHDNSLINIDITNLTRDAVKNENGFLNYIILTENPVDYVIISQEASGVNPEPSIIVEYIPVGNLLVIEPDETVSSINRYQHTEFRVINISTHTKTQYQLQDENNVDMFNLISNDSNIRKNGNIFSMDHLALKCFLKSNTPYRVRARFHDSDEGWQAWTSWKNFRTRDRDYKYSRPKSKNLPRPTRTNRGATVRNNVASQIDGRVSSISNTERGATIRVS